MILNVRDTLVSTPPLATPPLSFATTVTVATPFAFAAEVNVSVPFEATAGCAEKSPALSLPTTNETVCDDSSAGPGVIALAQPATLCAPTSSSTI